MRILIANRHREVVGGVETGLRGVLPGLADRGHEIALIYESREEPGRETIDGRLERVPAWCAREGPLGEALREAVAWRPDVVYSHGLDEPALSESLLASFPVVLFAHDYRDTCVSGYKRYAFPGPRPCARTLGPGCLVRYYPRRCGGLSPFTMLRDYRRQRRRQRLLGQYAAVLVASRAMRDDHRRNGVPDERLRLVTLYPPDLAPDRAPPADRPPAGRVLMVARLTDLKGGRFLIEALRQASRVLGRPLSLTVAGDGPERAALAALARDRNVPAHFVGWAGPARRMELMREADVLAVPSVWPEPFGVVGLEAGCVGLPAVAYAVGGIPDWLLPGESGELAPGDPPTPAGLADALVRAFADPAHLARLRQGAWRVAGRFTQERHLVAVEAVLEDVGRGRLAPD
jgi:glycosyltransferase involved in cell wall biosynthesis